MLLQPPRSVASLLIGLSYPNVLATSGPNPIWHWNWLSPRGQSALPWPVRVIDDDSRGGCVTWPRVYWRPDRNVDAQTLMFARAVSSWPSNIPVGMHAEHSGVPRLGRNYSRALRYTRPVGLHSYFAHGRSQRLVQSVVPADYFGTILHYLGIVNSLSGILLAWTRTKERGTE
jgi:hypothetical protein